MVGVWDGLKLGCIPNFFLQFGIHPKIYDVHPKLIPKKGVIHFCPAFPDDYISAEIFLYNLAIKNPDHYPT